jgi:hypothetical protein
VILEPAISYSLTVGGGGASSTGPYTAGNNGSNSTFTTITSTGGGGGGSGHWAYSPKYAIAGKDGGSGGGTSSQDAAYPEGSPVANQGFRGGINAYGSYGTGGGGSAEAGFEAQSGGDGLALTITGTSVYRGGGGGGGGASNGSRSSESLGGGGFGGSSYYSPIGASAGQINTGSGGGGGPGVSSGGTAYLNSGAGGSGVVILRYPDSFTISSTAGLTKTTSADGSFSVTTFTAGTGTISFA